MIRVKDQVGEKICFSTNVLPFFVSSRIHIIPTEPAVLMHGFVT